MKNLSLAPLLSATSSFDPFAVNLLELQEFKSCLSEKLFFFGDFLFVKRQKNKTKPHICSVHVLSLHWESGGTFRVTFLH